jgi:type III secretion system FlhB-like substrate exporter
LRYDRETEAPRLIAIARLRGVSAMTGEALRLRIPVFESPDLATALCLGEVGESIAEAHYASVAEFLSIVLSSDTATVS